MTFYDDPAPPATPSPFSGDQSGLDYPDVLLQSPTTTERIVDTQSGFLLVIKRMGERLALSCKRRVGTPPSSNILLTPDESIKLSKILASSLTGLEDSAPEDNGFPKSTQNATVGRRRIPFIATSPAKKQANWRKVAAGARVAGIVAVVVLIGVGAYFGGKYSAAHSPAVAASTDALAVANIDRFSRRFVSDMLDFNPDTYKLSQIQAMSYMSPELLEKYWKETNFPLTKRQLKAVPQGATVMITRIGQERIDPVTATADIYAELVHAETKLSSPVHIKLKLGVSPENTIKVLEQEDLTAGAH